MPDRTINFGDSETDARYRIQDTSSTGGDFVIAEDLDGGTVLLEYDYSAGEFVSRGPVNLSGNDITNAGSISAGTLEATDTLTGPAGNTTTDLTTLGGKVYFQETEPTETPSPPPAGSGGVWYPRATVVEDWVNTNNGNGFGVAIDSGTVAIGTTDNNVYGVDRTDGSINWSFDTGNHVESGADSADGKFFFGNENADVYALNTDGTKNWDYTTPTNRIEGGILATTNVNKVFVPDTDDTFHAVDLDTGSQSWTFTTGDGNKSAVDFDSGLERVVFGSDNNTVYALTGLGGVKKWSFSNATILPRAGVKISNGTVVVASEDNTIYGLDLSDGSKLWEFSTGGDNKTGIAIDSGTAVVGSDDNNIYGIDISDGSQNWSFSTGNLVRGGVGINNGIAVVPSYDGFVYGLDISDGSQQFKYDYGGAAGSELVIDSNTANFADFNASFYQIFTSEQVGYDTPQVSTGSQWVGQL